jgi:hypothetical protein
MKIKPGLSYLDVQDTLPTHDVGWVACLDPIISCDFAMWIMTLCVLFDVISGALRIRCSAYQPELGSDAAPCSKYRQCGRGPCCLVGMT